MPARDIPPEPQDADARVGTSPAGVVALDETTPLILSTEGKPCAGVEGRSRSDISPQRLLLPFLVYCIAMGAVAVPKINVILSMMCLQDSSLAPAKLGGDQLCDSPAVHARMGRFMMFANILSGVGCAYSSPRMGMLSGRYGRKPLLAVSALGLLFGDIVSIVAAWFPRQIPAYWVLLEFAIGGLTGSFVTTLALVQTYAADCTEGEERATSFSRFYACMYLGGAVGPAAGGLFVRKIGGGDLLAAFYPALVCHAAFILFVVFGLPESLPPDARSRRKTDDDRRSTTERTSIRHYLQACSPFEPLKILRPTCGIGRRNLPLLAGIDGVVFGTQLALSSVLVLYSEYKLGWKTMEASIFVSATNATRAVVLLLALPFLSSMMTRKSNGGESEATPSIYNVLRFNTNLIRTAILLEAICFVGFALAANSALFSIAGVVASIGACVSPTSQALMTNYVEKEKIGELMGTVSLVHALVRSVVPAGIQFVYGMTAQRSPEVVFWGLSGLFGGLFLLSLRVRVRRGID